MKFYYIITVALFSFSTKIVVGQTKAQTDSIAAVIIKQLQDQPPVSDSIIQKRNAIEARKELKLHQPDPITISKVAKYNVKSFPSIFETAYFDSTKIKQDSFLLSFYSYDIGNINIESGKIIACDPINMYAAKPFAQTFPIGKFPVQLSVIKVNTNARIAFSRIYFSNKPVAVWKFALDSGRAQIPIDGEELYGYPVDGGMGVFIDEKANKAFSENSKKDDMFWERVFTAEMNTHQPYGWEYLLFNFNDHNLAAFSTGFGDGRYATYVGYDDKGQPCRLLTDFGLVDWWKK